ncbi:uncharacterized protein ACRADG_011598 isoform 2-T2 [Cochliomyia hominivorax]
MHFLWKMFIYMTIFVIISILNDSMTQAMDMDEAPEKVSEFSPSVSRMRRNIDPQTADEADIPKEEALARFRTRRDAPPGESNIPQEFYEEPNGLRTRRDVPSGESDIPQEFHDEPKQKRQMPAPPGDMPMPPM